MSWQDIVKDEAAAMKQELDAYRMLKNELDELIKKLRDSNMGLGFQIDEIVEPLIQSSGTMEDIIEDYENPKAFDNPMPDME